MVMMEEVEMFYNLVGGGKTMDGPKQGLSLPFPCFKPTKDHRTL